MARTEKLKAVICSGCRPAYDVLQLRRQGGVEVALIGTGSWCDVCERRVRGWLGHRVRQALVILQERHQESGGGVPDRVSTPEVYRVLRGLCGEDHHPVDVAKVTGPTTTRAMRFKGRDGRSEVRRGWPFEPLADWYGIGPHERYDPAEADPEDYERLPWSRPEGLNRIATLRRPEEEPADEPKEHP